MGSGERKTYLPAGWPAARAYLVVFAVTLVERLIVLAGYWRAAFPSDGQDYVTMAKALRAGESFTPYWPPGLPLYLAALAPGGGVAVRVAMLALWGLFCLGFYRLAKALRVEGRAWIGLLVFGLAPVAVQMSLDPLTEMPVGSLLLMGLSAAVVCLGRAATWEYVVMGGSLGLMALVRPSALPLCVVIPVMCAWKSRRWGVNVAAAALGLALVGGWMVEAHKMCGAWVINTANGKNLWYGNNADTPNYRTWYFGSHAKFGSAEIHRFPAFEAVTNRLNSAPQVEQNAAYQKLAVAEIEGHPGTFLVRTANRVRCYFGFDTFTAIQLRETARRWFYPVLGLEALIYCGLMGFAFFWIAAAEFWRSWEVWVVGLAAVLYAAPYWVSMSHPTYHFPVVAPLLLLGLLGEKTGGSFKRGWVAVGILTLVQVEWVSQMLR